MGKQWGKHTPPLAVHFFQIKAPKPRRSDRNQNSPFFAIAFIRLADELTEFTAKKTTCFFSVLQIFLFGWLTAFFAEGQRPKINKKLR